MADTRRAMGSHAGKARERHSPGAPSCGWVSWHSQAMKQSTITDREALAHIRMAHAKLLKAVAAIESESLELDDLHAAMGQTLSAGRSLKRASENLRERPMSGCGKESRT